MVKCNALLFLVIHAYMYFELNAGSKMVLQLIATPSIAAPSFTVMVDPESITIPKSYDFPVACTDTLSKSLTVSKNLTWTSHPTDIISSHSTVSNSQGTESNSTAIVRSNIPGTYTISCQVTVNVSGDEPVIVQNYSSITVLGECSIKQ